MSTFAGEAARIATDPRRAYRMADRMAAAAAAIGNDPTNVAGIPPGTVTDDSAGRRQILASSLDFDRAVFAFDTAQYGPFTCNGQGSAGQPHWSPPGGISGGSHSNDIRAYIGPTDVPLYVWVWATMGWALATAGTQDHGKLVAVLYDSLGGSAQSWTAAANPASLFIDNDGFFHEMAYIGFFGIDPTLDPGADWNIGLQMQYGGGQQVTRTTINRQSIICFVSAGPVDGTYNTQPAQLGSANGLSPNLDFW